MYNHDVERMKLCGLLLSCTLVLIMAMINEDNDDDEEEERKFGDYCCHVHRGCQAQSLAAQTKRRRRRIRGDTLNSPL